MIRVVLASVLFAACDVSDPIRYRVEEACPVVLGGEQQPFVDNSCTEKRCFATAIESGCAISISLTHCEQSELRGIVRADGSIEGEESSAGDCRTIEAATGAYFSVSCARQGYECRIDVYPSVSEDFVSPRSLSLLSVPFQAAAGNDVRPLETPFAPMSGYISGAALVGGTIVVSTFDGRFDGIECRDPAPSRMFFVDGRSFTVSSSTAAPACLTRIAADPSGGGFLGVLGGEVPRLARFDARGTLGITAEIPVTGLASIATDLVVDRARSKVYVLLASPENDETRLGVMVIHELTNLASVATSTAHASRMVSLVLAEDGDVAVASANDDRIDFFDPLTAGERGGSYLNNSRGLSRRPGSIALHEPSGLLVVSTIGQSPGLIVLDAEMVLPVVAAAIDFEAGGAIWGIASSPSVPAWMIAGITEGAPAHRARAARFDPERGRFLPGSVELGRGPVSELFRVERALIGVLPWSAELVLLSEN